MNFGPKKLLAAPWSNQTVNTFLRGIAWLLTVLFSFGFLVAGYIAFKEGIREATADHVITLAVCFYLWLLFIFVARKGKAPSGWLPW